jgi:trimeric autotransporter adhesin
MRDGIRVTLQVVTEALGLASSSERTTPSRRDESLQSTRQPEDGPEPKPSDQHRPQSDWMSALHGLVSAPQRHSSAPARPSLRMADVIAATLTSIEQSASVFTGELAGPPAVEKSPWMALPESDVEDEQARLAAALAVQETMNTVWDDSSMDPGARKSLTASSSPWHGIDGRVGSLPSVTTVSSAHDQSVYVEATAALDAHDVAPLTTTPEAVYVQAPAAIDARYTADGACTTPTCEQSMYASTAQVPLSAECRTPESANATTCPQATPPSIDTADTSAILTVGTMHERSVADVGEATASVTCSSAALTVSSTRFSSSIASEMNASYLAESMIISPAVSLVASLNAAPAEHQHSSPSTPSTTVECVEGSAPETAPSFSDSHVSSTVSSLGASKSVIASPASEALAREQAVSEKGGTFAATALHGSIMAKSVQDLRQATGTLSSLDASYMAESISRSFALPTVAPASGKSVYIDAASFMNSSGTPSSTASCMAESLGSLSTVRTGDVATSLMDAGDSAGSKRAALTVAQMGDKSVYVDAASTVLASRVSAAPPEMHPRYTLGLPATDESVYVQAASTLDASSLEKSVTVSASDESACAQAVLTLHASYRAEAETDSPVASSGPATLTESTAVIAPLAMSDSSPSVSDRHTRLRHISSTSSYEAEVPESPLRVKSATSSAAFSIPASPEPQQTAVTAAHSADVSSHFLGIPQGPEQPDDGSDDEFVTSHDH